VLAVSGGIVASFAFPASAATVTTDVKTQAQPASTASLVPAASSAPLASRTFGKIAFEGVVKPQPTFAPAVAVPVVQQRAINNRAINNRSINNTVSRSEARPPVSAASTQTLQVAVPAIPALASQGTRVLRIAATLAGIPYRFGGTTRAGFDCSGFTQFVFSKVGVNLPRVAEAQRQATTRVSRESARPGDLVFFGAPAFHMGIYAGNNMLWDAPRAGKVISKRAIWTSNVTFGRVR